MPWRPQQRGQTESPGGSQAGPRQRRHSLVFMVKVEKEYQLRVAMKRVRNLLSLFLLKTRSEIRGVSGDMVGFSFCSCGPCPCDW